MSIFEQVVLSVVGIACFLVILEFISISHHPEPPPKPTRDASPIVEMMIKRAHREAELSKENIRLREENADLKRRLEASE